MAKKRTSVLIVDKKESLPLRVNHATRKWEIFDPATNSYKDTGIAAVPEDDATAMKYYKLSNTPAAPTAPGDSSTSWADIASLNQAVITQGGWSADPLSVSLQNRFCWAAYYRLENVKDTTTGVYHQKYKLNLVGLYNNYAASPTITVGSDGKVTITNPDGTTQIINLMTADSYTALMTMVQALQSQVDSAVYSYSGKGVPTKDYTKAPLNSWGIKPNSPSNVIADIYNTHVGDTYTNTDDYVSYRFVLKEGASASDPVNYVWQVIADGALSAALQEIAKLGNASVKIFTAQPKPPYKRGDMWVDSSVTPMAIKTCIIAKDVNGTFAATDWIVPFATKEEVEAIRQGLTTAQTNLLAARGNITDLQRAMSTLENETLAAMKDNIISENERKALKTFSDQLDVEQEQLLSNVAYLKASPYLPATQKTALENAANKLLTATTGTLDVLQAKIAAMLNPGGDQGSIISTAERTAYENALAIYKVDHKALSVAIDAARAAVDAELKRLNDEKVDGLQIGGRNLLPKSEGTEIGSISSGGITASGGYGVILENNAFRINSPHGAVDTSNYIAFRIVEHLKVGQEYTISFDAKTSSASNRVHIIRAFYSTENKVTVKTGDWRRYSVTFKLTHEQVASFKYFLFWQEVQNGFTTYLRNIKVEYGSKATAWTKAPEDTDAEISALIAAVDVEYGLSSSATVAPTAWQTTSPTWQVGKFIWQRVKTTLKDGTVKYSNTACIQGAEGKGIRSIVEEYYVSTSATSQAGGSWSTAVPPPQAGRWIWARSVITYTDSTTTQTAPMRYTGDKGVDGADALLVSLQIQGQFKNYWVRQPDDTYLLKKEIIGGVTVNGTKYVEATAVIRKGVTDVTDSAIAKGAALEWYVNGVKKFGNVKKILLGVEYADGNDDQLFLDYDDTNAANW